MTLKQHGPAMQAAIIRGLVRRLTDLKAAKALNAIEIEQVKVELAKARKGEF